MPLSIPSVVIAILLVGLAATSVQPSVSASDRVRLDAAAYQLASLIRITQAEALRTDQLHGVIFEPSTRTFTAVRADASVEPFAAIDVLYHPIRKQPLQWVADSWIQLNPSTDFFNFGTAGNANQLLFDAWGTPVLDVSGSRQQLATSTVELVSSEHNVVVTVSALNGRIEIQ